MYVMEAALVFLYLFMNPDWFKHVSTRICPFTRELWTGTPKKMVNMLSTKRKYEKSR